MRNDPFRLSRTGLGCLLALLAACSSTPPARELRTPYPVRDAAGNARTYRLFLPPAAGRRPLLAYFHGVLSPEFKRIRSLRRYTGSPVEETGLVEFCRERGIILLVPDALYGYTFLNCPARGWVVGKEADGIEKVIDTVIANQPVDRNEVFLAGLSAGAGLCHHLANRRPDFYRGIISHSQAYVDAAGRPLPPREPGPRFGVVFAFNEGDYANLIRLCVESEALYRGSGYRTVLLSDLPPRGHAWSATNNARFWELLNRLGRRVGDGGGGAAAAGPPRK
ncbi:MAG TPA: PHB depolymerase family esterase [Candidatus Aminicenantes bacterium]|nr:PHB depolymerase family esterase [Candidatus Aminicenantes bacterium]